MEEFYLCLLFNSSQSLYCHGWQCLGPVVIFYMSPRYAEDPLLAEALLSVFRLAWFCNRTLFRHLKFVWKHIQSIFKLCLMCARPLDEVYIYGSTPMMLAWWTLSVVLIWNDWNVVERYVKAVRERLRWNMFGCSKLTSLRSHARIDDFTC